MAGRAPRNFEICQVERLVKADRLQQGQGVFRIRYGIKRQCRLVVAKFLLIGVGSILFLKMG